jgi:hypothetical protein
MRLRSFLSFRSIGIVKPVIDFLAAGGAPHRPHLRSHTIGSTARTFECIFISFNLVLIWTLGNCWVAVERASVTSIVLNAVDENPLFSYSPTIVAVFDVNIPRSDAKGIVIRADV